MYCPNCGKENTEGTFYCPECGNSLFISKDKQQTILADNVKLAQIIIFVLGLIAFFILLFKGVSLSHLRSVSGDSVAEKYYQGIGIALIAGSFLALSSTVYKIFKLKK